MRLLMARLKILLLAMMLGTTGMTAQKILPGSFSLDAPSSASGSLIPSNSVSHITIGPDRTIWTGTGKGLARLLPSRAAWESFRGNEAFASDGIFSVTAEGSSIWASTGFEKDVDGGTVQTGTGYAFSADNGASWTHLGQTLDDRGDSILVYGINDSLRILPIVVPEQNVTFDISIYNGTVWVASWASGLRKSTDMGLSWERILLPPDGRNSISPGDTLWSYAASDTLKTRRIYDRFDPRRNNNFLAFSVLAVDDMNIWCGTAGGINRSTDGGISWVKYNHTNQSSPIMGNWVIAVQKQVFTASGGNTVNRIWTTNWQAEGRDEEFGVSYSDDDGRSWVNLLHGVRAYDFSFRDSVAYIATNKGVFRTSDGGASFDQVTDIVEEETRRILATTSFFSVGSIDDTVYVGTADGLAWTMDNASTPFGSIWRIDRAYQPLSSPSETYAYPNPFSPNSEPVRIHYAVSQAGSNLTAGVRIEIFDFGMNRVRTLINQALRDTDGEYDELWDGTNDAGTVVANGVYFYRVDAGNAEPAFGKIIVMQ
jgi:hypothetical protein